MIVQNHRKKIHFQTKNVFHFFAPGKTFFKKQPFLPAALIFNKQQKAVYCEGMGHVKTPLPFHTRLTIENHQQTMGAVRFPSIFSQKK
ncbi:hypothetical protein NB640_02505 [Oxalobacter vibrioformis]|uniref:Uncharacterized protein n=1 Tax=Oxalobacter vibrioformis TaxID=933080 RepID=A0A9E9LX90_9BURK|nr:hypothetical protein [Oxalobacter vibrioformis]WAW10549.1 hypothetical protein NB640_02505 [Oxalobacter vibrioformis]